MYKMNEIQRTPATRVSIAFARETNLMIHENIIYIFQYFDSIWILLVPKHSLLKHFTDIHKARIFKIWGLRPTLKRELACQILRYRCSFVMLITSYLSICCIFWTESSLLKFVDTKKRSNPTLQLFLVPWDLRLQWTKEVSKVQIWYP